MAYKVHHVGYAVPNLEKAQAEFEALGWKICGSVTDDVSRQVRIAFMEHGGVMIELVAPTANTSPVAKLLEKGSGAPYHVCYEVPDLDMAVAELKRAQFLPFTKVAPAPAIGGRRVVFMYAANMGVLELVER